MKLTKKILEQIIKEELSLIKENKEDPVSPLMKKILAQQRYRQARMKYGDYESPDETYDRIAAEREYEKTIPGGKKFLAKFMFSKDLSSDPCRKKQKTKLLYSNMTKSLAKLSEKELTFIENNLYDSIRELKGSIKRHERNMYEELENYESINQAFEEIKAGDPRSEEAQDMVDNINDGSFTLEDYNQLQENNKTNILFARDSIATLKCIINNTNEIINLAAKFSGEKAQAQSDKEKRKKSDSYGRITIRGTGPDAGTEYYIDSAGELTVTKPSKIKESNTKLTKLRLEQFIKEELSKLT